MIVRIGGLITLSLLFGSMCGVSFYESAQMLSDLKSTLTTNNIMAGARQEAVCRYMEQLHTNLTTLSESWQQQVAALEQDHVRTIETLKKEHELAHHLVTAEKSEAIEEIRSQLLREIEKAQTHLALVLSTNEQQEALIKNFTEERNQLQAILNEKNNIVEFSNLERDRLAATVNTLQEEKNALVQSVQETNSLMATLNANLQSTQWEAAHLDSLLKERSELKPAHEITADVLRQKDEILQNALQEHRILQNLIDEKNGMIERQKLELVGLAAAKEGNEQITTSIKDSYQMAQETIKTLQTEVAHLRETAPQVKEAESTTQLKLKIVDLESKLNSLHIENKQLEKKLVAHAPITSADQAEITSKFAQLQMETAKQTAYIKKVEHMYGGHDIVHNQLQDHEEVNGLLDTALVILAGR